MKSLLIEECQVQHSEGHIANPVEQKHFTSNYSDFFVCLKMRIHVFLQRQKSWSTLNFPDYK